MCRRFALDLEWDAVAGPHNRRRILARRRAELRHCVIRRLQFHEVAPLQGDGKRLIQPLDSTEPMRLF